MESLIEELSRREEAARADAGRLRARGMPRGPGRWRLRCSGGITRTRLETGHGRLLATLFGTVTVTRCAWRKPGAPDYLPADASARLGVIT